MDLDAVDTKGELNFVNLADRPSAVRCGVSPYLLLCQNVSSRISNDGTKEIDSAALLSQACQEGNLEAFVNLCELMKSYPENEPTEIGNSTFILATVLRR